MLRLFSVYVRCSVNKHKKRLIKKTFVKKTILTAFNLVRTVTVSKIRVEIIRHRET
jgi:hypothetical protein